MNTATAQVVEIFSSLQGEGLYAGERMLFVRLASCNLRCRYCDTPQGLCDPDSCRVETPPQSARFANLRNPLSAAALSEAIAAFDDPWIAITGGEPLQQADFLGQWLPAVSPHRRVLLETNGVRHDELRKVLPFVHVVSMDLKLPSSTGGRSLWAEHAEFLRTAIAAGREVYVKIVVTPETTDADLQQAIGLITRVNRFIPTVIQPVTPTLAASRPVPQERLGAVERLCHAYLEDVRTVPQLHRKWGVL